MKIHLVSVTFGLQNQNLIENWIYTNRWFVLTSKAVVCQHASVRSYVSVSRSISAQKFVYLNSLKKIQLILTFVFVPCVWWCPKCYWHVKLNIWQNIGVIIKITISLNVSTDRNLEMKFEIDQCYAKDADGQIIRMNPRGSIQYQPTWMVTIDATKRSSMNGTVNTLKQIEGTPFSIIFTIFFLRW